MKQRRALLACCTGNELRASLQALPGPTRQLLLDQCAGPFAELVEAAALTGARPGELASATRSQFDKCSAALRLSGKVGARVVPLSPAATALFTRATKGKLPGAPLLAKADGTRWRTEERRSRQAAPAVI